MKTLSIAIAGLGTVGADVVRLLAGQRDLLRMRTGCDIVIKAVSVRDKSRQRNLELVDTEWVEDARVLATRDDIDMVVELIGGADGIAYDLVTSSLDAGKAVVTANKAMLAKHAGALFTKAEKSNAPLRFEAAVAAGIPVIKHLREGFAANRVDAVYGILNGTCNYILTEMDEKGLSFDAALKEAQALGYAETDPTFDVDGFDTAHKISILAALAFGALPAPDAIRVRGIRDVSALDIAYANELGYKVKLLGIARKTKAGILQSVEPVLIDDDAPIAAVDGVLNAVYLNSDFAGESLSVGRGAGGRPTASAVVADIVDIARGAALPPLGIPLSAAQGRADKTRPVDANDRKGHYYMRMSVNDRPGVIADVSAILRDLSISIETVLQRARAENGKPVPVVITTHETTEGAMTEAVKRIEALEAIQEPPHWMRIETSFNEH